MRTKIVLCACVAIALLGVLTLAACEFTSTFEGQERNREQIAAMVEGKIRQSQSESERLRAEAELKIEDAKAEAASKLARATGDFNAAKAEIEAWIGTVSRQAAREFASQTASLRADTETYKQSADAAIASIARQEAAWAGVRDAIASPQAGSIASMIPYGGVALTGLGWFLSVLSGRHRAVNAEQIGIAKGRDIGWTEREEHQSKIDATWEEASARKGAA